MREIEYAMFGLLSVLQDAHETQKMPSQILKL